MVDSCFVIDSNFLEMTNIDVKIKLGQLEGNFTEVEQLLFRLSNVIFTYDKY